MSDQPVKVIEFGQWDDLEARVLSKSCPITKPDELPDLYCWTLKIQFEGQTVLFAVFLCIPLNEIRQFQEMATTVWHSRGLTVTERGEDWAEGRDEQRGLIVTHRIRSIRKYPTLFAQGLDHWSEDVTSYTFVRAGYEHLAEEIGENIAVTKVLVVS